MSADVKHRIILITCYLYMHIKLYRLGSCITDEIVSNRNVYNNNESPGRTTNIELRILTL